MVVVVVLCCFWCPAISPHFISVHSFIHSFAHTLIHSFYARHAFSALFSSFLLEILKPSALGTHSMKQRFIAIPSKSALLFIVYISILKWVRFCVTSHWELSFHWIKNYRFVGSACYTILQKCYRKRRRAKFKQRECAKERERKKVKAKHLKRRYLHFVFLFCHSIHAFRLSIENMQSHHK